jgi:heme exporter protein B
METSSSISGEAGRRKVEGGRRKGEHEAAAASGGWWSEALAVLVKDVRSELRTRAALATILPFAVVTLIIASSTVNTRDLGFFERGLDKPARSALLSALLWIVLFFSAMAGLPRTFVKEEEMRTAAALRLASRASAVFVGKLLFNSLLVLLVAVIIFPLFLVLFTPPVTHWGLLVAYLVVGSLAMAGSATILGAIVARAGGKTYLMLPLAFPVLLPILAFVINGTSTALMAKGSNQLLPLVSYLVAMVTLSLMLFDFVWNDA